MNEKRKELQIILENILGSDQVYFQPPETIKMSYPAIVFSFDGIYNKKANNKQYITRFVFHATLITKSVNSDQFLNALLNLEYCSLDKPYMSDGLYHYPFTIYK